MIRSTLRAVYHVATELLPLQAFRCIVDRDYAGAMYTAAAKHDGAEQRAEYEAEEEVSEPRCLVASAIDRGIFDCECSDCIAAKAPPLEDDPVAMMLGIVPDTSVDKAIEAFNEFVRDHTEARLHAHFADNDDNAAERVRRAIRRAALVATKFHACPVKAAVSDNELGAVGLYFKERYGDPAVSHSRVQQLVDDAVRALTDLANLASIKPPAASAESAAGSPAGLTQSPSESPAGHLTVDWLVPAICEVLAEHRLSRRAHDPLDLCWYCYDTGGGRAPGPHGKFPDEQAWREHVAPLIAEHILKAIAAQPK